LKYIEGKLPGIWQMIIYTLFFRFITEELLFDFVSLSIDFKMQIFPNEGSHVQLKLDFVLLIASILLIALKIFLIFQIIKTHAIQTSKLWFLFNGLSYEKKRIYIYFAHFIFI